MRAHHLGSSIVNLSDLSVLFSETLEADIKNFLFHFVGFTSHCGLIKLKLGSLKNNAINGVVHTVLNINNVTNVEVIVVNGLHYTATEYLADVL